MNGMNKFHTEVPRALGAGVQDLVIQGTWHLGLCTPGLVDIKDCKFSVMLHGSWFKMTSTILYAKFCASEKKTMRYFCLPKVGVNMMVVYKN
jgi:hypothetical protein